MVGRAAVPRRGEKLWRVLRVPRVPRHLRGRDHARVHDRHVDVLHAAGADAARRVLVYVRLSPPGTTVAD